MTTPLTPEQAQEMLTEIFIYHMPFNRELGLELRCFNTDYAEITFTNQPKLVGNVAQQILHGGVIASVLDVAAGMVCVGSTLMRHDPLLKEELLQRLSKIGTIDLRVDYLRPGRGELFIASASLIRSGNKVAVARVELHNQDHVHIASATAAYMVG